MEISELYNKKVTELSDEELDSVCSDFEKVSNKCTTEEFVDFGEKVKDSVLFKTLDDEYDALRDKLWKIRDFKDNIEFTKMYGLIGHYYKYCPFSSFNEESDDYEFVYVYSVFPHGDELIVRCLNLYEDFCRVNDAEACGMDIIKDIRFKGDSYWENEVKKFHTTTKEEFIKKGQAIAERFLDELDWAVSEAEHMADKSKER